MAPKPMGSSRLGSIFLAMADEQIDVSHYHHLPGQIPKIGKETGECVQKIHIYFSSLCSCAGQEKRDPCHSTLSVTKVSSQHMTSGISAVMTLPCSTPQALRNALYSLLSILIKSECSPLCQGVPAFLCQTLLQRSNVVLRVVSQVWPGARQAAAARWLHSWASVWAPGRECHGSMQTKRTGFAGADQMRV